MFQNAFLSQLLALLYKQTLIFVRSRVSALFLLFGPSIFVLIAATITTSNLNSGGFTVTGIDTDNTTQSVWSTSSLGSGSPLQPCQMYSVGGSLRGDDPCVAIAYAPTNVPQVKQVMERLARKNNLNHAQVEGEVVGEMPTIREGLEGVDVVGFETEDALEQYLRRVDTYGYIHATVFFNDEGFVNSLQSQIDPRFVSGFVADAASRNPSVTLLEPEKSVLAYRVLTNTTIGEKGVTPNTELNIQTHITESLMAMMSKKDDASLKINIKKYTGVNLDGRDQTSFFLPRMVAPLLFIGSMGLFVVVIQNAVTEKHTEKFDNLRSMGLSDGCYWLSWMIFYAGVSLLNVIPTIIMGHVVGLSVFTHTPFELMLAILYLNNLALVGFALFLSSLVNSPWGANAIAMLFTLGGLLTIAILFVFNRGMLASSYHQFDGLGAFLDVLHHIPVFAFPRIIENMVGMTYSFRGGPQRHYTMEQFQGGTYQYYDLMENAFGHQLFQVPDDPRDVLAAREACARATKIELGLNNATNVDDEAFLKQYRCLTYIRGTEAYRPLQGTPGTFMTASEIATKVPAKCIPGWSWALGETRSLCENNGGLFIPLPRDEPAKIFVGNQVQLETMELYLGLDGKFPFVYAKRDLSAPIVGNVVHVDSLEGYCACIHETPSDSTLLSRLGFGVLLFPILAWYFGQIRSTGQSKGQSFLFVLTPWYWFPTRFSRPDWVTENFGVPPLKPRVKDSDLADDIIAERERVKRSIEEGKPDPIVMQELVKVYGRIWPESNDHLTKREVNGINLGFKEGEVFALLGHNGAGKTTLTKMLLGLTRITGGNALVRGLSVGEKGHATRQLLSTCPQHDILWHNMSAPEHLMFFGLFQGLSMDEVKQKSNYLLDKVKLLPVGNRKAGAFSGGMQRRLSVAISFIGNRPVTFLDEPTTGMDPQNRSHIWELITEMKQNRTVILTTHAMDEANNLGDRIGIMKKGQLIALGTSSHLRSKYGGIHRIEVVPQPKLNRLAFVHKAQEIAPHVQWYEVEVTSAAESIKLNLPVEYPDELSALFGYMRESVSNSKIQTWIFSGATLEDVFLKLTDEEKVVEKKVKRSYESMFKGCCSSKPPAEDENTLAVTVNDDDEEEEEIVENTILGFTGKRSVFKGFRAVMWKEIWAVWGQGHNVTILAGLVIAMYAVFSMTSNDAILLQKIVRDSIFKDYVGPVDDESLEWKQCVAECVSRIGAELSVGDFRSIEPQFNSGVAGYAQSFSSFTPILSEELQGIQQFAGLTPEDFPFIERDFAGFYHYDYNPVAAICTYCGNTGSADAFFPNTNKNAKWFSGQLRPFTSSPLKFGIDRFLVAIEPRNQEDTEKLSSAVGSLCPNPAVRPFGEPLERAAARDIGLTHSDTQNFFKWEENPLVRFPGESGRADVTVLQDVYDTVNGKATYDAAKAKHDLLKEDLGGLLAKYPSKVLLQNRLSNSTQEAIYYDSSPLMCPADFYEGIEVQDGQKFEDSLVQWMDASVTELREQAVEFPASSEEEYSQVDEKTSPIALVFHDAELDNDINAPKLEFTIHDLQTFTQNGSLIPSQYVSERYSETVVEEVVTGMGTAILRQLYQVYGGDTLEGFTEDSVVQVGHGSINEQWLFRNQRPSNPIAAANTAFILTLLVILMLSMIFPQIAYGLIMERERRIRHMMQLVGLSPLAYWLSEYVFWVITMSIFLGIIALIITFAQSPILSPLLMLVVLLYTNVMLLFAMLFSSLVKKGANARPVLYTLVIVLLLTAEVLHHAIFIGWDDDANVTARDPDNIWWFLIPTNAAYYAVQYAISVNTEAYMWDLSAEMFYTAIQFMAFESIALALIVLYLDQIISQEYGVARHWLFPLEELLGLVGLKMPSFLLCSRGSAKELDVMKASDRVSDLAPMDEDVLAETKYVLEDPEARNAAIYIKNLSMVFQAKPEPKIAVSNLNLHVAQHECFGLLGPNGAGKSTTMSILTGLYPPTSGYAAIQGQSIANMKDVRPFIGICAQMDIVWPNITVEQHLKICGRLNGSNSKELKAAVISVMNAMDIMDFKRVAASELSGGTRRRLSMAMSLIGNPSVWFLDEPTTGVDPDTRRKIWAVIQREKQNRSIVLTTHSMEEAEVLCDRIGIMAHGKLRTLGTLSHLKNKFATGYVLSVTPVAGEEDMALKFVRDISDSISELPRISHIMSFELQESAFSEVVKQMDKASLSHGIIAYELRPTTLEDVFIKVAKASEVENGVA